MDIDRAVVYPKYCALINVLLVEQIKVKLDVILKLSSIDNIRPN